MKVLFLAKYYSPAEGGIERYSHMLCCDLLKRGVEVEVIAASETKGSSREEVVDGVKVSRLNAQALINSTPITLELPSLLRSRIDDFDLVHLNFPNPWTDLLYLALCRKHKAVMTYHSDIFRSKRSLGGLLLKAYQPFIYRVLRRVDGIIASSPNLIENSPFLTDLREKSRAIPMPVDQSAFSEPDIDLVGELRGQYRDFALFVGRLVYYKGVRFLIEAMEMLERVNLVIVGTGPLELELKQQVNDLGLESRIFFAGNVSDYRRQALYHACKCFVLPSIAHAEGFGIVLAEAMACGKPVISTELMTGTSYVNLDGVTGYVVNPCDSLALAEKIDLFVRNNKLGAEMGQRARQRIEGGFTREIVTDQTLALYSDVIAGNVS
jgi:glycosyltransferase involved in cell wall biosynthesis